MLMYFQRSLPFILGLVPLRCGFNLTIGMWNMLGRSFLVILCVIAQIKVYYQTRKYLNQHRALNREQTVQDPNTVAIPMKVINSKSQQVSSSDSNQQEGQSGSSIHAAPVVNNNSNSTTTAMRSATFFVHRGNKSVSKLEIEASKTLIIGILSLCIITGDINHIF